MSVIRGAAATETRPQRAAGAGPVIDLRGLSKAYATARGPDATLENIDFSVDDGEFVAILGPSGCGKSTSLKILAGFYTAYQGFTDGIAVPADSPINTIRDLKGKTIGVTSIASGGNLVGRALAAEAGFDPDKDVSIVVADEGAQMRCCAAVRSMR
jgi:energy-coupling factor transporter ATP-binding protein EcfA2